MKKIRTYILALAAVLCTGSSMTSCNDDMPAESYYTFTGEMVSDFLLKNEDYSKFAAIVTKAGLMDQLSAYGEYTCFAATNQAVDVYLAERGFNSVEEIPVEICDTIARTHLFSFIYYTADFASLKSIPQVNMLRRFLSVTADTTFVDEDSVEIDHIDIVLNNKARLISSLMNDSVENGVVHPVNAIIEPSNLTVNLVLEKNPRTKIFYEALKMTGLAEIMSQNVRDPEWDPDNYPLCPGSSNNILLSNGHQNRVFAPEERRFGYTIFVVPDDVIEEKLKDAGITTTGVQGLYDYACKVYDPLYKVSDEVHAYNDKAVLNPENPLNRLIAYHCLNRQLTYSKLTVRTSIDIDRINPTEWYETMAPFSTLKIENATVKKYVVNTGDRGTGKVPKLFINRARNWKWGKTGKRGAKVTVVNDLPLEIQKENIGYEGINGYYYYVDDILDYGEETRTYVFNDRMRLEIGTLFPELATNGILGNGDNSHGDEANTDGKFAKNYWFPAGYLDDCKVVGAGVFHYQFPHNCYWSYQGDEFNLKGNTYDVSLRLPPVPEGQYEIRLGFCATGTRGIAQIYLDGSPQGIPLDMTISVSNPFIGGHAQQDRLWEGWNETQRVEQQKLLKNNGYYRGPAGVYNIIGTGHHDDDPNITFSRFYNNEGTIRKVLCQVPLSGDDEHWLRFRSVYSAGGVAELMIDYIEIVPKSVYGVEGEGQREDDL